MSDRFSATPVVAVGCGVTLLALLVLVLVAFGSCGSCVMEQTKAFSAGVDDAAAVATAFLLAQPELEATFGPLKVERVPYHVEWSSSPEGTTVKLPYRLEGPLATGDATVTLTRKIERWEVTDLQVKTTTRQIELPPPTARPGG